MVSTISNVSINTISANLNSSNKTPIQKEANLPAESKVSISDEAKKLATVNNESSEMSENSKIEMSQQTQRQLQMYQSNQGTINKNMTA